jgi:hypothetical protein
MHLLLLPHIKKRDIEMKEGMPGASWVSGNMAYILDNSFFIFT